MSVSSVGLCLIVLTCIVNTLVEGGIWRRHHGHHSRYHGFKNPISLDLLPKHSKNNEDRLRHHDVFRPRERTSNLEAQANSFPSLEYEDTKEVQTPIIHQRREVLKNLHLESLRMREINTRSKYKDDTRGMRHVRHSSYLKGQANPFLNSDYEDMEAQKSMVHRRQAEQSGSRAHVLEIQQKKKLRKLFEFEVKKVQNSSICSYTVKPVPNVSVPKMLEHVKCNHLGSSCLGTSTHCCIQTYRKIEVLYNDGSKGNMTHYVGCVCAYEVLLQEQQTDNIDY